MACIVLLGRHRSTNLAPGLLRLADALIGAGHAVLWEPDTARNVGVDGPLAPDDLAGVNVMVSYGGDGTVLSAARRAAPHRVPVLAIHKGRLGFLADFTDEDLPLLLETVDRPTVEPRLMLTAELVRHGEVLRTGIALNDVVVARALSVTLIEFELLVNNRRVCVQRADGFVVSTPVGSTAYNLTAGGPILLPELDVMALAAICPQKLTNRPVVVGARSEVVIRLITCQDSSVHFDGQNQGMLEPGDEVRIRAAVDPCLLVVRPDRDRFQVLQEKLGWNA